jgi:hypothetical protein
VLTILNGIPLNAIANAANQQDVMQILPFIDIAPIVFRELALSAMNMSSLYADRLYLAK